MVTMLLNTQFSLISMKQVVLDILLHQMSL